MNKTIKLGQAVDYTTDRVSSTNISIENFVTTDSMLSNKAGISVSIIKPTGVLPAYSENDILVGNIRPYLKKIWFADRNGGCSPDVLTFKVKKEFDPKFIYYALFRDDFFIHMMKGSKGTKMPRGDKDQILDFLIPDLNPSLQNKIGSFLSMIDAKIEINRRINFELEEISKTIYDYWFVQYNFPDADGQPYKSNGGQMAWDGILKRKIPIGWSQGNLCDIADFTNGLAMQKFRPTEGEMGLRVIKIKEMNEGFSDNSELARLNIPRKAIINNGDVLFSWSASLDVLIWSKGVGVDIPLILTTQFRRKVTIDSASN